MTDNGIDGRLDMLIVSVTTASAAGGEDCSASSGQDVSCIIPTLAVDEWVIITVRFEVDSSVPEADGVGGLNDGPVVPNSADVRAEASRGDSEDPSDDVTASGGDNLAILVDIDLSIVKTFDPDSVPQGTNQSFTIVVSNGGPSDALIANGSGVSISDTAHGSLEVRAVTVAGDGSCTWTVYCPDVPQTIECLVDIPAGESVTITVDYTAAPFLSGDPSPYGTTAGDDFRFVFVNGSILEGSTQGGSVYLDGVDITSEVTILSSLMRNDLIFDPAGDDPAFEMHLSCSDPFTGGWGQSAGPVEGIDVNWQIAYFSIARYNSQGFFKNCGNVVNSFEVPNTATATGTDSFGTQTVSDDDMLTIGPGITLDTLQTNGKRLTARLTNYTGDAKTIDEVSIEWPNSNGELTKVWLTFGRTNDIVWDGTTPPPETLLQAGVDGWIGGTLLTGEAILRFDFQNKVDNSGYTIRVNFTDGTFLDIRQ
ncbi:MAG: hypothetical protein P1T08_02605 [Acidimicrobiia bacterium]|nr:hypothetical protein [Acidimicrobiia bacterium]